ncbi:methylaspartate mutase, partial [Thermococci archaeon]
QQERTISEAFAQTMTGATLVDMMSLALLIGSGGVLSHAPRRVQSAMMMLDAFQPEGITMLTVDSIFMMPHLGVLSNVHEEAATEVFDRDCLIRLGSAIAPKGTSKEGKPCMNLTVILPDGRKIEREVKFGEFFKIPLGVGEKAKVVIEPDKNFDVGAGKGKRLEGEVEGGVVGVIVDCRGRPLLIPEDPEERVEKLSSWIESLEVYPIEAYNKLVSSK